MKDFIRNLCDSIEASIGHSPPWGDMNPLVVIGLTEAMLDLHLTEDQMFAIVRSYSRQLASQVHPDRQQVNVSVERQKQILSAFDVLDNRENFDRALAEFRLLKSSDRNETNRLREALRVVKEGLTSYHEKELLLKNDRDKLDMDKKVFDAGQEEHKRALKALNNEVDDLDARLARSLKRARVWEMRFKGVNRYILSLTTKINEGLSFFDARWVAVASLASPASAPISHLNAQGGLTPRFLSVMGLLGLSEMERQKILSAWDEAVSCLGHPGAKEYQSTHKLVLTVYKLKGGRPEILFGSNKFYENERIIGSIPLEKEEVGRRHVARSADRDSLFEKTTPLLVPGGILVSGWFKAGQYFLDFPLVIYRTKRIILVVG